MDVTTLNCVSGIYIITNRVNGYKYVGQSYNILKRALDHCKYAKRRSPDMIVERDMKKYGLDNFEIKILEKCGTDKLGECKRYWIKQLQPEYNEMQPSKWLGRKKESRIGVRIVELDKTFPSLTAAAEFLGKSYVTVRRAMLGYLKTAGGYHIERAYLDNLPQMKRPTLAKKVQNMETGEIFESLTEAAQSVGITLNAISRHMRGLNKTAGGHHWQLITKNNN